MRKYNRNFYSVTGIRQFCNDMNYNAADALAALTRWTQYIYNIDENCFDHSYNNTIELNSQISTSIGGSNEANDQRSDQKNINF